MSFEATFLSLMPHRVAIRRFSKATTAGSSQGTYGSPGYTTAAATTYSGRFVMHRTQLLRPDGTQLQGSHVAWLATTATINTRDKCTFTGTTYEILDVGRFPDEAGQHHTKLILRHTTG